MNLAHGVGPQCRRRLVCLGDNGWKACPGLVGVDAANKALYLKHAQEGFDALRLAKRVSTCLHVLNTIDICAFPALNAVLHESLPVQLVTSDEVFPTHPVTGHLISSMFQHSIHTLVLKYYPKIQECVYLKLLGQLMLQHYLLWSPWLYPGNTNCVHYVSHI